MYYDNEQDTCFVNKFSLFLIKNIVIAYIRSIIKKSCFYILIQLFL